MKSRLISTAVVVAYLTLVISLLAADSVRVSFHNTSADRLTIEVSLFTSSGNEEVVKTLSLDADKSVEVDLAKRVQTDGKLIIRVTRRGNTGGWYGVSLHEVRGGLVVDVP